MKKVLTLAICLATASPVLAAGTSQATATPAAPGIVSGVLDASGNMPAVLGPETLFMSFIDQTLTPGFVDTFGLAGLSAGGNVRAQTHTATNLGGSADTVMRALDSSAMELAFDDDGGPGLYSEVSVTAPGDGLLDIQVSGYPDTEFTGEHVETDPYDLDVFQAPIITPQQYGINVQWWSFSGLIPGSFVEAETSNAVGFFDTILMVFDSTGAVLGADDDDGAGLLSAITLGDGILVPANGIVLAAVTTYQGFGSYNNPNSYLNENMNDDSGTFDLTLTPEPGSLVLLAMGVVGLIRRRR